jgi:hypothetical protein
MPYDSILLGQQDALFKMLGPNVKTTISPDGHTLVASGITETQITQVQFITNNANNNAKLHFDDIKVYLDNEYEPSTIYGLVSILKSRVSKEDAVSLIKNNTVYQPFLTPFQNNRNVNDLCDALSAMLRGSADTKGRIKTYTLTMGNACTSYCSAE